MAIIDVVRFDGLKNRDWLVYKYPSESLVVGTQLIVQEGQVALFVRGGKLEQAFTAGTYTLNADNLPILKGLVNKPFGGKTPFSCEVYFINTIIRLEILWGTADPIQLVDPKYNIRLRVRAFGQMGIKVHDAEEVFLQLIGAMNKADIVKYEAVRDFYRGLIALKAKSVIADAIITDKISALEIAPKLDHLSNVVRENITPEIEKFGFEVVNFFIKSINFPNEDFEKINKILEDKAAFDIMGDSRYAAMRTFDVYEGAANNDNGVAGAFVAGGMGIGAAAMMHSGVQAMPSANANEVKINCPKCGAQILKGAKFCSECGFNMNRLTCDCGFELSAQNKFCPNCGKQVSWDD